MNSLQVTGYLVRDARTFSYENGSKDGVGFTVAYVASDKGHKGFIDCTLWGADEKQLADAASLKKDVEVTVTGDLSYSEWESNKGEKHGAPVIRLAAWQIIQTKDEA